MDQKNNKFDDLYGYGIREMRFRKQNVRLLMVRGAIESATFTDPEMRNELVFPYLSQLSFAFSLRPEIRKTLLIGGGAFAYPKYYISHYPDREMDVVEIDGRLTDIAKKHFYLDELLADESRSRRLRIINEDGFDYLLRCADSYDFIIDDAYSGKRAIRELRSETGIGLIRRRLTEGGIYAVNVAAALRGPFALRGRRMERMLKKSFRFTTTIPCDDSLSSWSLQNSLMFASDREL